MRFVMDSTDRKSILRHTTFAVSICSYMILDLISLILLVKIRLYLHSIGMMSRLSLSFQILPIQSNGKEMQIHFLLTTLDFHLPEYLHQRVRRIWHFQSGESSSAPPRWQMHCLTDYYIIHRSYPSRDRHTAPRISGPCWRLKQRRNKRINLHNYFPLLRHFYIDIYKKRLNNGWLILSMKISIR